MSRVAEPKQVYDSEDAPWVIVTTKPSSEETAERSLRQAGYRVYLPRYRKMQRGHRLPGWRMAGAMSMRPAFKGYLFVQDWHGWPLISINGIIGLMKGADQRPKILSDADVSDIWEKEHDGAFDQGAPPAHRTKREDLQIGDQVQFESAGQRIVGSLKDLSENGRAIVEAMIFNRASPFNVDADDLEVVGA